jgi:hypothetical protein
MPRFIESDFDLLRKHLIANKLVTEEWLAKNLSSLRIIHKIVYSFLVWDSCIRKRNNCGKVFLHELRSDAIQSIPIVLGGYKKATALLLRGLVENTLRYIYYSNHPVEYTWLNSGHYMQIKDLIDYAKKDPRFSSSERARESLDELWSTYTDISKYVHAQATKHMELVRAMEEIRFDHTFFKWYLQKLKKFGSLANLLLIMFNHDRYASFDPEFKRLLVRTVNKGDRHLV